MTTFEDQFRSLALSALQTSGSMLDSLAPEAQAGVDTALQMGAQLQIEFGPLPSFQRLALVLVEAEGARHTICTAEIRAQSLYS